MREEQLASKEREALKGIAESRRRSVRSTSIVLTIIGASLVLCCSMIAVFADTEEGLWVGVGMSALFAVMFLGLLVWLHRRNRKILEAFDELLRRGRKIVIPMRVADKGAATGTAVVGDDGERNEFYEVTLADPENEDNVLNSSVTKSIYDELEIGDEVEMNLIKGSNELLGFRVVKSNTYIMAILTS